MSSRLSNTSFNSTLVQLKALQFAHTAFVHNRFNSTLVQLKAILRHRSNSFQIGFNSTLVQLKENRRSSTILSAC